MKLIKTKFNYIFFILSQIIIISKEETIVNDKIKEGTNDEFFINDMKEEEFIQYNTEKFDSFYGLRDSESSYCEVCKAGISIAKNSIIQEYTWEYLHSFLSLICSIFLRKDICYTAIGRYGPFLIESLIKRLLNSETICTGLYLCSPSIIYESYEEYATRILKDKNFQFEIPSFENESRELKFIQITDIHLQQDYRKNTVSNCGIPLCCRNTPEELGWTNGKNLEGENIKLSGKYGSTGNCDSNIEMVKAFAEEAVKLKPDFILFTGDNSAHNVWEVNQNEIIISTKKSIDLIVEIFGKEIPIYPVIGNHEKAPPDIFYGSETILLHGLSKIFRPYLTQEAYDSFSQYGFYTMIYKNTNLRIVSLNCLVCDNMNFNLIADREGAEKMYQWLEKVLNEAEKAGELIYLLDHIPMQNHQNSLECTFRLKVLLDRYQNIIRGYISAHTHREEISLIHEFNNPNKIIHLNYISPSLTTYFEFWPSFRLYLSDYNTKYIREYIQYRFNLDESNKNDKKIWFSYNGTSFFNVTTMSDLEGVGKANIDENYVKHCYTDNPENVKKYTNPKEIDYANCLFHNDNRKDIFKCINSKPSLEAYMHHFFDLIFKKFKKIPSQINK